MSLILDPTIQQLIAHVFTKFQNSSFTNSWKNCDKKELMVTCKIWKERKTDNNRRIRAMTLSLNPTIQSPILHMYTMFEDSSLHSSSGKCDTRLALKYKKEWIKKEKKKQWYRLSIPHYNNWLSICIPSCKILATTVPEKNVTQKAYGITELRCYGIMDRPNPV